METSGGTHLGKGSFSQGRMSAAKSKEFGRIRGEDAKKQLQDSRKGNLNAANHKRPTPPRRNEDNQRQQKEDSPQHPQRQKRRTPANTDEEDNTLQMEGAACGNDNDDNSEEDADLADEEHHGSRKKPAVRGRKLKSYKTVADVDVEIANLKPPPQKLGREDFASEYGLLNEPGGMNPHRYRKNSPPTKLVRQFFGEPSGEGGRNGFFWQKCEHASIRDRIKFLHPIIYQHSSTEVPALLKMHFAEGVAMEYEKGAHVVNWCLFGEETNKRQRNRHEQDLRKLQSLKNSLLNSSNTVKLEGMDWRSIKVEPGVKVEDGGGTGSTFISAKVPGLSRLRHGETAGESGVSADCQGFRQGLGTLSKEASAEALIDVESIMAVVHMEGEALKIQQKEAISKLDYFQGRRKEVLCFLGNFKRQMDMKLNLIGEMTAAGANVERESIKLEMLQEQLQSEEQHLTKVDFEVQGAETATAKLAQKLVCQRLEFDALLAQSWSLKKGKPGATVHPRPMVYAPIEDRIAEVNCFSKENDVYGVRVCSLCALPFPHSDIVVSSCNHLYHPFCAFIVFGSSNRCTVIGCNCLPHPEWHRSYGWGEPTPDLMEKAMMLGLPDERRRILQDRLQLAKSKCPPAVAGQVFAHPANSPANFTEGATSHTLCSPKAAHRGGPGLSQVLEDDIDPQTLTDPMDFKKRAWSEVESPASKVNGRKKKKKAHRPMTENDKDGEPDFTSESESSQDGLALTVRNLPSSSGTTISDSQNDSVDGDLGGIHLVQGKGDDEILEGDIILENPNEEISKSPNQDKEEAIIEVVRAIHGEATLKMHGGAPNVSREGPVGEEVNISDVIFEKTPSTPTDLTSKLVVEVLADAMEVKGKCEGVVGMEDVPGGVHVGQVEAITEEHVVVGDVTIGQVSGLGVGYVGDEKGGGCIDVEKGNTSNEVGEFKVVFRELEVPTTEERKEMQEENAPIPVTPKKTKRKDKKEGKKKKRPSLEDNGAPASQEDPPTSELKSYLELSKISTGACGDNGEVEAHIEEITRVFSPPGKRTTRSQQGTVSMSTQVDIAPPRKHRAS